MNKFGMRIGLVLIGVGAALIVVAQMRSRAGIPADAAYGRVPDFALTESSGRTVQRKDLLGKPWVVDFIFTSCAGSCPLMTAQMRKLQDALPVQVGLLSFSVDPQRDTPEVLVRYARQYQADSQRWWFLTGDRATLYNVSINGFKLPFDDSQGTAQEPITHSSRFVLIDRNAEIRGFYSGAENFDLSKIVEDAKRLL